jgi:pimeloyl-ACP methyl ester carboxylesterase
MNLELKRHKQHNLADLPMEQLAPLVAFVNSLDSPPLLVGHSLGGLLAQLVAARTRHAGRVAACPAPAAGIFCATPTSVRILLPHLLRLRPWTEPWLPPTFEQFRHWIANTQTEDIARQIYDGLVCESGRHVRELLLARQSFRRPPL